MVRRQVLGCLPFNEALQAGRIGLWRAIQGYDVQRGLTFSTYAWTSIMHHVWQAVKVTERHAARRSRHLPLHSLAACALETADPADAWPADSVQAAVWDLVRRLPEPLRLVVVARYGLTGEGLALYSWIGALLGVSGERARQLHIEALLRLRRPAHSQQLRSLLGRHTLADYEACVHLAMPSPPKASIPNASATSGSVARLANAGPNRSSACRTPLTHPRTALTTTRLCLTARSSTAASDSRFILFVWCGVCLSAHRRGKLFTTVPAMRQRVATLQPSAGM